jgi:iron transport multicopper oxidase
MHALLALRALPLLAAVAQATMKIQAYEWNITWVNAAPDGTSRPVVGINNQWPCPPIVVLPGDIVRINVYNGLGNETTALHFHGLFQNGTSSMDGPAMVNQCPIPPGETFVYQFVVTQVGTFWYHAHVGGQYIDGLRGPFIIKDPDPPHGMAVDEEYVLTISDWYHDQAPYLINKFLSANNSDATGGAEPVPNSALMNEMQGVQFPVQPHKSYLFHIINMGAMAGQYLQMDGHDMTIVEVDGVYVQPEVTSQLFVGVAQRYSVIVKTKLGKQRNFAITAMMDADMFDSTVTPAGQQLNVSHPSSQAHVASINTRKQID